MDCILGIEMERDSRYSTYRDHLHNLRVAGLSLTNGALVQVPPPPRNDVEAYTAIFSASTSTPKALTGFASNAKKASIRSAVASHLQATRLLPDSYKIPKVKKDKPHINPYLDYWDWSCKELEYAGPEESVATVKTSHYVLPIFMHHFGCVAPSFEAIEVLKQVAGQRTVIDMGSGNGYWSFMLRRHGLAVEAVDNGDAKYRTLWIGDTVFTDGEKYLKSEKGAKEKVLLLVYPVVGGEFTKRMLAAYEGNTICVAGTQNGNGYTGFKDMIIDQWMEREKPEWKKKVQIALPSFPGKDEALFVFERG